MCNSEKTSISASLIPGSLWYVKLSGLFFIRSHSPSLADDPFARQGCVFQTRGGRAVTPWQRHFGWQGCRGFRPCGLHPCLMSAVAPRLWRLYVFHGNMGRRLPFLSFSTGKPWRLGNNVYLCAQKNHNTPGNGSKHNKAEEPHTKPAAVQAGDESLYPEWSGPWRNETNCK